MVFCLWEGKAVTPLCDGRWTRLMVDQCKAGTQQFLTQIVVDVEGTQPWFNFTVTVRQTQMVVKVKGTHSWIQNPSQQLFLIAPVIDQFSHLSEWGWHLNLKQLNTCLYKGPFLVKCPLMSFVVCWFWISHCWLYSGRFPFSVWFPNSNSWCFCSLAFISLDSISSFSWLIYLLIYLLV